MSTQWQAAGKDGFYHISRGAEIVVIKDRDVVAFIPETIPLAGTSGMEIYRDSGESSQVVYKSEPKEEVKSSERLLLWARLSGSELATSFRWVPYVTSSNPDEVKILPLREVYDPRVTYDRTSNMLHLWFWTNIMWDYSGADYDESQIIPIGYRGYAAIADKTIKRVLCYAVGQIGHYYVKGGLVQGFVGQQTVTDQYDMVPVFARPTIITNYSPSEQKKGPGLVTDGWYICGTCDESGFICERCDECTPCDNNDCPAPCDNNDPPCSQDDIPCTGYDGPCEWCDMGPCTCCDEGPCVCCDCDPNDYTGTQGPQGNQGTQGNQGNQGDGFQGYQGVQGVQGDGNSGGGGITEKAFTWDGGECRPALKKGYFWYLSDVTIEIPLITFHMVQECLPMQDIPGYCPTNGTLVFTDSEGDGSSLIFEEGRVVDPNEGQEINGVMVDTGEPAVITVHIDGTVTGPEGSIRIVDPNTGNSGIYRVDDGLLKN